MNQYAAPASAPSPSVKSDGGRPLFAADEGDLALIAQYEQFLAIDPRNALLLRALADLYLRTGAPARAEACVLKALEVAPDDLLAKSRLASAWLGQGRTADAEALLREVLAATGPNANLLATLGLACYRGERWAEASEALDAAHEAGITSVDNFRLLAYALHRQGALEEAIAVAEQWQTTHPDSDAAGYLALLWSDRRDPRALEMAEAVLRTFPDDQNANVIVGIAEVERQEPESALARFTGLVQRHPDNPRGLQGLAMAYMLRQDYAAAIANFERALELMPDNSGTWVALGWAHLVADDLLASERTFRRAVEVDRNFAEAHGGLASALVLLDRRQEAKAEVELARRLDSGSFGWVHAQSVLLALEGKREVGERLYARALNLPLGPGKGTLAQSLQTFIGRNALSGRLTAAAARLAAPPGASTDRTRR